MPERLSPGVVIFEDAPSPTSLPQVGTTAYGVVGTAERGPVNEARLVGSFPEFVELFGSFITASYLAYDVQQYFDNGGTRCYVVNVRDSALSGERAIPSSVTINDVADPDNTGTGAIAPTVTSPGSTTSLPYRITFTSTSAFNVVRDPAGTPVTVLAATGYVAPGPTTYSFDGISIVLSGAPASGDIFDLAALVEEHTAIANSPGLWSKDIRFVIAAAARMTTKVDGAPTPGGHEATLDSVSDITEGSIVKLVGADASVFPVRVKSVSNRTIYYDETNPSGAAAVADNSAVSTVEFHLDIYYRGALVEQHRYLSTEPTNRVNHVVARLRQDSRYLLWETIGSVTNLLTKQPAPGSYVIAGGTDGNAVTTPDLIGLEADQTGIYALDAVDEMLTVGIPDDQSVAMIAAMSLYCERREDRFGVACGTTGLTTGTGSGSVYEFVRVTGAFNTSYVAFYFPWAKIYDPLTGTIIKIPICGMVAGTYARVDVSRGVAKSPMGERDTRLPNVIEPVVRVGKPQRDVLYPARINFILKEAGVGTYILGDRTLSETWPVMHRRYYIYLKKRMEAGMRWVIGENIDYETMAGVELTLRAFLTLEWQERRLFGVNAGEAFYVRCNDTINTEITRRAGILKAIAAVSLQYSTQFLEIHLRSDDRRLERELAASGIAL